MARGFRGRQARAGAQRRLAAVKWLLVIGGLAGLGWLAYAGGAELARQDVRQLQDRLRAMEDDLVALTSENAALRDDRDESRARLRDLQQRYDRDVPSGEVQELVALLRQQLAAGVDRDRLRFLIGTADDTLRCDGDPDQRRFIVQTGLTRGRNDFVTFAGDTIIVRAQGAPSVDRDGRKQAWFDETQPVTVRFETIDGSTSEAAGVLPLRHAVIRGGQEFRFVVSTSPVRGFVQVTAERCQLPAAQ